MIILHFHIPAITGTCQSISLSLVRPTVRPPILLRTRRPFVPLLSQSVYQSEGMSVSQSVGHFSVRLVIYFTTSFCEKQIAKRMK